MSEKAASPLKLGSRVLGRQGLCVSELGLGCVGMSELYGPRDLEESRATIERALELGVTFFDTADIYGAGHNESFLGSVLRGRREPLIVATKFGAVRNADGLGYSVNSRPEYVEQACEASLRRLGRECIDLYYQHRPDPDTPIEDTVGAMSRLVEAGWVRFLGLSECSADDLRKAHAVHPISAIQIEYSLFSRSDGDELLELCRELGVGVVAYSPLGRGLLTGAITADTEFAPSDFRRFHPRFRAANLARNLKLVAALQGLADARNCTVGQLALAWLLGTAPDIVPIPGTKRRAYLEQNCAAAHVRLTRAECEELSSCVPPQEVAGERSFPSLS